MGQATSVQSTSTWYTGGTPSSAIAPQQNNRMIAEGVSHSTPTLPREVRLSVASRYSPARMGCRGRRGRLFPGGLKAKDLQNRTEASAPCRREESAAHAKGPHLKK